MKQLISIRCDWAIAVCLLVAPIPLFAFDSGSTGADGAFAPTTSQSLTMPEDGIFHYTTVNIPAGVTITYTRNAANTPVIILAQGDVFIDGDIDVSGQEALFIAPASGGPGGFDGGLGGPANSSGGNGHGPGGAEGGRITSGFPCGGAGGGFGVAGSNNISISTCFAIMGGQAYGAVLPLIGGSGGGGGGSNTSLSRGGGGGGGGGTLMIAASGTLRIDGGIFAKGGNGETLVPTNGSVGAGGGGSGGAIRLVATELTGTGVIDFRGGLKGTNDQNSRAGADGAYGRARIEAENLTFTGTVTPSLAVISQPQPLFVSNLPGIRITTVDGVAVPAIPNGISDVILPSTITNPVTVAFAGTDVPLGAEITLTMTPVIGTVTTAVSSPLTGTEADSTASASIDLPQGPSVLSAAVSFSVTVAMGGILSVFAEGEQVARVDIEAVVGKGSQTTFVAESGKKYTWPSNAIAFTN